MCYCTVVCCVRWTVSTTWNCWLSVGWWNSRVQNMWCRTW